MSLAMQLLIDRLTQRGISFDHIPGVARNVLQIIGGGGLFTTHLVNEKLELLGWGSEVLDETSFQLIVYLLKSEWGYRVHHYNVGPMGMSAAADWERLRF